MWVGEEKLDSRVGEEEYSRVASEFKEFDAKMHDPLVVGALLHKLATERENTNRLMLEINSKLDRIIALEQKVMELEAKVAATQKVAQSAPLSSREPVLLAEVDERILEFVKVNGGKVNAAQVQAEFNYKGRNAASSRLHALFTQGLLDKKQAGKTVYYLSITRESRVTGVLE